MCVIVGGIYFSLFSSTFSFLGMGPWTRRLSWDSVWERGAQCYSEGPNDHPRYMLYSPSVCHFISRNLYTRVCVVQLYIVVYASIDILSIRLILPIASSHSVLRELNYTAHSFRNFGGLDNFSSAFVFLKEEADVYTCIFCWWSWGVVVFSLFDFIHHFFFFLYIWCTKLLSALDYRCFLYSDDGQVYSFFRVLWFVIMHDNFTILWSCIFLYIH